MKTFHRRAGWAALLACATWLAAPSTGALPIITPGDPPDEPCVNSVAGSASFSPTVVELPQSAGPSVSSTLRWSTSVFNQCPDFRGFAINNQNVSANGSMQVSFTAPGTYRYELRLRLFSRFITLDTASIVVLPPALPPPWGTTPPAEQSFGAAQPWAQNLSASLSSNVGWSAEQPRLLADMDGDHRQDVVGFGNDGTWVGLSNGTSFNVVHQLGDFGYNQAWRVGRHVRLAGDINGDGKDDVVGFGNAGVYRSLSSGSGLGPTAFVIADLGYDQGWRVGEHERLLADVNGDGRKDIVAYGIHGVWLALADANGNFSAPALVVGDFGSNQGWTATKHVRTTGDINGDGRQDLVAFGDHGVWIALSTGTGFTSPALVLADFAFVAGGWQPKHPRFLVDLDNDRRDDIVGFGDAGVYSARSNGAGFDATRFLLADFGINSGWSSPGSYPRFVTDVNADGYKDIMGFGSDSMYRSLGSPGGFQGTRGVLRDFTSDRGWIGTARFVGDVNGDNIKDLIAWRSNAVLVALGSMNPPPPPPPAPTNLRVTGTTTTAVSLAWNDNSTDERNFVIRIYRPDGTDNSTRLTGPNAAGTTINNLAEDTEYCFRVSAESPFGTSAESFAVCARTKKTAPPTSGVTSVLLNRQIVNSGPVPYTGSWGPIIGARALRFTKAAELGDSLIHFVRSGHNTTECFGPNHSAATVTLVDGGSLGPSEIAMIYGGTPGVGQGLQFVACLSLNPNPGTLPSGVFFNVEWGP